MEFLRVGNPILHLETWLIIKTIEWESNKETLSL